MACAWRGLVLLVGFGAGLGEMGKKQCRSNSLGVSSHPVHTPYDRSRRRKRLVRECTKKRSSYDDMQPDEVLGVSQKKKKKKKKKPLHSNPKQAFSYPSSEIVRRNNYPKQKFFTFIPHPSIYPQQSPNFDVGAPFLWTGGGGLGYDDGVYLEGAFFLLFVCMFVFAKRERGRL